MKRTRSLTLAAWTLLALILSPLGATAQEVKESPSELITRLRQERAQLRMELGHAKMSLKEAQAAQAQAVQQTKEAAVGRAALQDQISKLTTAVQEAAMQNVKLQALLKADAAGAADTKLKDALGQLVDALRNNTALKANNDVLADQNKTQKDASLRLEELFSKTRKELVMMKAALSEAQQQLAIEKGKHVAPVTVTTDTTPPKPVTPKVPTGVKPKPKPEATINTTVRAVKGDLASIGLGAADGITDGMKLVITRGNDYLATLVIIQIEKNQAAGKLINIKAAPRPGDRVGNMP